MLTFVGVNSLRCLFYANKNDAGKTRNITFNSAQHIGYVFSVDMTSSAIIGSEAREQ